MVASIFSIFTDSLNSFEGQEKDERVLLITREHPFPTILRLSVFTLAFFLPFIADSVFWNQIHSSNWTGLFLFLSSIWCLLVWLVTFYTLTIYTLNTLTVTDRRIIQSKQYGFFDRQISELHLSRVQDVTTHTSGMIETLLKYGDVMIQTAASEKEFNFRFIPHPDKVRDVITQAASMHVHNLSSV